MQDGRFMVYFGQSKCQCYGGVTGAASSDQRSKGNRQGFAAKDRGSDKIGVFVLLEGNDAGDF